MTLEEFDKFHWRSGLVCVYDDKHFNVVSVDFVEQLVGICFDSSGPSDADDISWVRCENVRILE